MNGDASIEEAGYDRRRLTQWLAGRAHGNGMPRRDLFRLSAGFALAAVPARLGMPPVGRETASAPPVPPVAKPIVKPLPPELFTVFGSNAEMRWEAMRHRGLLVPVDRFFVRNHTSTPVIDANSWRLRLHGTGLRGAPTLDKAVEFSLEQLHRLPSASVVAAIECAGNGRGLFTSQQGQRVTGTAWRLGAIGVARWRGVRLSTVLRHAGLSPTAVDVMAQGLDPEFVDAGIKLGHVRRPLPVAKAMHDVLLAYEMNGQPLPPDHGFPLRLVVPSWIGVSSIKWVGQIEVSATPLMSPWNVQFYRLFGPGYPTAGAPVTEQVVKSAFELAWDAQLPAGRTHVLHGRSWSGHGPVRHVEVSTDGGVTWRRAHPAGAHHHRRHAWQRWHIPWHPTAAGRYTLRARATDATGVTQPDRTPLNSLGYLFDAVVEHPVTIV